MGTERVGGGQRPGTETFRAFYRSQYHAVVALAYALTGKAAVAEELAQDAFLVAYRNWGRISGYEVPGAYVRRVVTNMSVSFHPPARRPGPSPGPAGLAHADMDGAPRAAGR